VRTAPDAFVPAVALRPSHAGELKRHAALNATPNCLKSERAKTESVKAWINDAQPNQLRPSATWDEARLPS
jgi:hypothetical protein